MSAGVRVTGLGLVTPLAVGVEATWTRLVRGDRAIRPVTLFDVAGQRVKLAGQVDCARLPGAGVEVATGWSRTGAMAVAAAREAMSMAGLDASRVRVGLVVGGTTGGMFETEQLLARLHAEPEARQALVEMLSHPLTATADRLQEQLGPFSRVRTLASACSSGANAIVVGAGWLLAGEVDAVVVGGSDGLCRLTLTGFNALAALDPEPCRPFDRRRRGASLGEGAGFLVLERADGARARGSQPVAELAGWALGSEAHHITNPAPDGAVVAALIARAVARAGLTPADIDYVNAHGTGTLLNDSAEAAALGLALGNEARRIPVSSSKGQIGHTLGAAGAIEAVITALVVARGTLVPTAGLDEPDPALPLVHVPHVGREVGRVRAALSNAFGFGGMDTVLVLTEPQPSRERGAAVSRPASPLPVITGVSVFGCCGLLGAEECAELPTRKIALDALTEPDSHLDPARARRLDRPARLGAVAVQRALAESGAPAAGAGLVLGSAFGNVDGSASFMHRVFDKGPRLASPAEFPNLVPSSPVGHVSIYLGLRGPAFATADFDQSGESAFVQAAQLVAAGEGDCVVAGALEPKSGIVERVLSVLFGHGASQGAAARTDLAVAIVLEGAAAARRRGARALARVGQAIEWRGDDGPALASLRKPRSPGSELVLARADDSVRVLVERTPWREQARVACAPGLGESDGLGAVAIAVAAARIDAGLTGEVLVVGLAPGRGYAIVLEAP